MIQLGVTVDNVNRRFLQCLSIHSCGVVAICIVVHPGSCTRILDYQQSDHSSHVVTARFHVLQPGMSLPDNIRSLFGTIPGAMSRGSAISAMAGPGFITGAEANQTHAQAGTRAGGWAEGMGSNANAVNGLAGIPFMWAREYKLTSLS